jgi:ribokinase
MAHVVVVGSINMDLVVRTHHMPVPGETVLGSDLEMVSGGKGGNQVVAAARLAAPGTRVSFVGCVGDDAFSERLRAGLLADGINCDNLLTLPGVASGTALIVLDENGQNCIVVSPGANHRLTPDHVRTAWARLGKVDALIMPFEIPFDTIATAAALAAADGVPVIFNPAPAPREPLPAVFMKHLDVIIPNESETRALTQVDVSTQPNQAEAAAKNLVALGPRRAIVTLGAAGALAYENGTATMIPSHKVQVVDTVAAGDCFVGAVAVRLVEGATLAEAARFGNAASAISVTRPGAQPSLPKRDEVLTKLG